MTTSYRFLRTLALGSLAAFLATAVGALIDPRFDGSASCDDADVRISPLTAGENLDLWNADDTVVGLSVPAAGLLRLRVDGADDTSARLQILGVCGASPDGVAGSDTDRLLSVPGAGTYRVRVLGDPNGRAGALQLRTDFGARPVEPRITFDAPWDLPDACEGPLHRDGADPEMEEEGDMVGQITWPGDPAREVPETGTEANLVVASSQVDHLLAGERVAHLPALDGTLFWNLDATFDDPRDDDVLRLRVTVPGVLRLSSDDSSVHGSLFAGACEAGDSVASEVPLARRSIERRVAPGDYTLRLSPGPDGAGRYGLGIHFVPLPGGVETEKG